MSRLILLCFLFMQKPDTLDLEMGTPTIKKLHVGMEVMELLNRFTVEEIITNYEQLRKIDSGSVRTIPAIWPVNPSQKPYITSTYGYRIHPLQRKIIFHNGIDIGTLRAFNYIYATADGVVSERGYSATGFGNYVKIMHSGGFATFYGHMAEICVWKGQKIKMGEPIGWMGSTGSSTGKHLHYIVERFGKTISPLPFLTLY